MFRDQNADSPAEVRLSRSGDIFLRLVPSNPAGKASWGRDQSAGYARRSHQYAVADAGSIPAVSINDASPFSSKNSRGRRFAFPGPVAPDLVPEALILVKLGFRYQVSATSSGR